MSRSRARRLIGHSSTPGPTLTERHRILLDTAMRKYQEYRDDLTRSEAVVVGARHAVRAYATVVALNEGGFYPDVKTSVRQAESMSLQRIRGKVDKHTCGGLILVNGMCNKGHDPSRVY